MKVAIPWVCVFALLVGCFFLYATTKEDEKEIAKLHQDDAEVTRLRSENVELQQLKLDHDEMVRLRNEHEELLRLRSEAGQLQKQTRQLTSELNIAKASAAMKQQQQSSDVANENKTLRVQNEQLQQRQAQANTAACINNLRRIEDSKILWANENHKPPGSVPTAADLAVYFPNNTFPVCPEGGGYNINAVGLAPTCTITGHTLPRQ
jgi:hypothetical protein